jgi:hypothetical protein
MVQYIPRAKDTSERFAEAFGAGTGQLAGDLSKHFVDKEKTDKKRSFLSSLAPDIDWEGASPEMLDKGFELVLTNREKLSAKQQEAADKLKGNSEKVRGIEKERGLEPGSLSAFDDDPIMAEKISKPTKEPGGVTAQPVPPNIAAAKKKVLKDNADASASDLEVAFDEAGVPPIHYHGEIESRRRAEEQGVKSKESKEAAVRAETGKLKQEIVDRANAARKGIQNKERLLELIKTGNIDDPSVAAILSSLPLNIGKRLLSAETVQYKAGLVDEFTDLRNIFQGQTRVKELDILEDKLADIYLTDEQKKRVLEGRIDALQADVIREEAALEVEEKHPNLGILEFNKKVDELAHEKMKHLFNKVLDEHKFIINQAEQLKNIELDVSNPEHKQVMDQIMVEAGGDPQKAFALAKKKGYKFAKKR